MVDAASKTVEAFSITHAAVLDGTTGAESAAGDIYGVRSGNLEADTDSYDNTGDDAVLSTWFWFNFANVTIQSGFMSFDLIAELNGSTVTSSGAVGSEFYSVPLWDERSFNQPAKPVLLRCPSKDKNSVPRTLDIVLFKVQFQPQTFTGPQYKDGMLINYNGRALMSDKDEAGNPLAVRAPGRLLSRPQL